jgi:polar amino acid transport system permease protein
VSVLPHFKPTTRKRIARLSSYAVGFAFVAAIAAFADWPTIVRQFFNLEIAAKMWPSIITVAVKNTLWLTFVSFVLGMVLAVGLAVLKVAGGPLSWFAVAFIEFFRGIPALMTIFAAAFVIPIAFGTQIPGGRMGAAILGLTLVTGAYGAEIIRAGIEAVASGQSEAARSLGMTSGQTMFWVVLPQALRIVIPPVTNEMVMLLKDSSLVFVVGLGVFEKELTSFGRDAMSVTGNPTPLFMAAIAYLGLTLPLTYLASLLEKKLDPKR